MFEAETIETVLFYCFAAMMLAGAFGVLLSRNIVRTAVWLLATLAAAGGLYFLLGASFVGAIQLIVYAGGTLVLIIFGVMLTSRDPKVRFDASTAELAAGGVVCVLLAAALVWVFAGTRWHGGRRELDDYKLGLVYSATVPASQVDAYIQADPAVRDRLGDRDAAGNDGTANIGRQFLGDYLAPFEITSILLLAVLIGAAYLARPKAAGAEGESKPPSAPAGQGGDRPGDAGKGGAA